MFIAHKHRLTGPTLTGASFQFNIHSPFAYYDQHVVPDALIQNFRSLSKALNGLLRSGRSVETILKEDLDKNIIFGVLADFNHEFTDRTKAIALEIGIRKSFLSFDESRFVIKFVEFLPLADEAIIKNVGSIPRLKDIHRQLSDEILDLWGDTLNYHLSNQRKSVFIMKTWAWEFIRTGASSATLDIAKILDYDMLLFPVNLNDHWIIVEIKRRKKAQYDVRIYDSLIRVRPEIVQKMKGWIKSNLHSAENIKIEYPESPQQDNVVDCGIYACMNMAYLSWGHGFDYKKEDIPLLRRWMLYYFANHISENDTWKQNHTEDFMKNYFVHSTSSADGARRRSRSPESSLTVSEADLQNTELWEDLGVIARQHGWTTSELREKAAQMGISIPTAVS